MSARLALVLTLVLAAPASPQDPDPQSAFEELAGGFLSFHLYFNPVRASYAGERDYDSRLPDVSRGALQARAEAYQQWLDRLSAVDPSGLVGDARQDRTLLEHAIRAELLELVEVRRWERDPASYVDLISAGMAILVEDTGIPRQRRMEALTGRLRQVATVLAEAKANLAGGVPELFVEPASRSATRLEGWLRTTAPDAFAQAPAGPGRDDLARALSRAADEVAAYREFLMADLPRIGDFRLGPDRFAWLLRYQHHVELPAVEALELLEAEMDRERAKLEAHVERSGDDRGAAAPADPLTDTATARTVMAAARTHVFRSLFVTVPSDEQPRVALRPPLLAWDTHGVWGPGPLQPLDGPATLYLIEADESGDTGAGDAAAAVLAETFPGEFVERLYARRAPTRLRKVVRPATLYGGWSDYASTQLLESGFDEGNTALREAHSRQRLVALAEARAAIRMHVEGSSIDEASAEVARDAHVSPASARSVVTRAAHRPLVNGILGSLQIQALRDEVLAASDDDDSRAQRHFHDAFLASGLPPALARTVLLEGMR